MKFSKEDNLKRIADALERISPLPVDNKNLEKSNLFLWKTNPDRLVFLENYSNQKFHYVVKNVKKIKKFNFFRSLFTKYSFNYIKYSRAKELRKYRAQKSDFLAPKNLVLPCQKNFFLAWNNILSGPE